MVMFLPITLFFVISVEFLFNQFYEDKWSNAVLPLQIFLIIVIFKTLSIPSNSILYAQERPEISAFLSLFRALSFTLFFTLIIISSINFNHLVALYGLIDIFIIFLYMFISMKVIKLSFSNYLKIFIRNPSLLCLFLAYIIFFLFLL